MRRNTKDETLKKHYIQKYQFLIKEYEQVKTKNHPLFHCEKDFYRYHGTCAQTFLKYYGRYKNNQEDVEALLPLKRGPRYKTRRPPEYIEALVLKEREKGGNKYEINHILKPKLEQNTPQPSTIYKILKRYGKNKLSVKNKEEKRFILKEKAGELGHIDCHNLAKDTMAYDPQRYYVLCVVDSCTRVAWAQVMTDIKALSTMFATLHCLNHMSDRFNSRFCEVLTDNGPEFGPKTSTQKQNHPFKRLMLELGIKHCHTRPYRPQTNGKVERCWRTLNEDLIEGTHFTSIEHFKKELYDYMLYYNKLRPHQALNGQTPDLFAKKHQRMT